MFDQVLVLPLRPCAWLHNFQRDPDSALLDAQKFADVLVEAPLFAASDADAFGDDLEGYLGSGHGESTGSHNEEQIRAEP